MKCYEILCDNTICAEAEGEELRLFDVPCVPLYLANGGTFAAWMENRALSSSRGFTSRNLKSASGLSTDATLFETVMKVHAACVTDHYWVREKGEEVSWEDVNFEGYRGFYSRLSLGLDNSYERYFAGG